MAARENIDANNIQTLQVLTEGEQDNHEKYQVRYLKN